MALTLKSKIPGNVIHGWREIDLLGVKLIVAGETDPYVYGFMQEGDTDVIKCSQEISGSRGITELRYLLREELST